MFPRTTWSGSDSSDDGNDCSGDSRGSSDSGDDNGSNDDDIDGYGNSGEDNDCDDGNYDIRDGDNYCDNKSKRQLIYVMISLKDNLLISLPRELMTLQSLSDITGVFTRTDWISSMSETHLVV